MSNIVIIGSGPAGVSAALYAARAGVQTTVLTKGPGALDRARLKMLSPLFAASATCLKTLPKSPAKERLWSSLINIPCYVG